MTFGTFVRLRSARRAALAAAIAVHAALAGCASADPWPSSRDAAISGDIESVFDGDGDINRVHELDRLEEDEFDQGRSAP